MVKDSGLVTIYDGFIEGLTVYDCVINDGVNDGVVDVYVGKDARVLWGVLLRISLWRTVLADGSCCLHRRSASQ